MILILSILLLLATPAHAIIIIGGTGAAPDPPPGYCTTQSTDVSLTVNNATSIFYSDQDRGQSWESGVTGSLYSIQLRKNADLTAATLTLRIGVSSNLSTTYLSEFTCTVPYAAGVFECVIPQDDRPSLTSGTTYYLLMRTSGGAGDGWVINRDSTGGYANGTAYYDITKDWVGTVATSDLYFITRMCD